VGPEEIAGKEDLLLLQIREDRVGPVQERRVDEPERLPPELQLVVADDAEGNPAFTRLSTNVFAERERSTVTVGFRSSSSISAPAWSGSEWLTIT